MNWIEIAYDLSNKKMQSIADSFWALLKFRSKSRLSIFSLAECKLWLIFLFSSGNINSKNWHLCCIFSVDEILHIFSILYYQRCVSKSFLLDRSGFPLKMNKLVNLLIEETLKIYGSNLFIFGKTFLFRLKSFENVFLKSFDIPQ